MSANTDATWDELRYQLEQKTGVLIGRSTVGRMLTKLNITVKKNTPPPTETLESCNPLKRIVNGCNSNAERETSRFIGSLEFWQLIQGILSKDLIFIDESGINLALTRLCARSPKGSNELRQNWTAL